MKKYLVLSVLSVACLAASCSSSPKQVSALEVSGCNLQNKLPTTVDLNDCSSETIRSYYASLNSISAEERQGTNLLKNLKPILYNMNYFTYATVWKIYEITDRDWSLSPASETSYGTYSSSNNILIDYVYGSSTSDRKNDPYVRTLYRDYSLEQAKVRNWDSHTSETNREHIWCQSRGFKASSGASGPAGTDIHHLQSGDAKVNTAIHNNNPYGYVDVSDYIIDKDRQDILGNKRGTALHKHSEDELTVVFEPRDEYKGDIARACFYMAARYNNYSGTDEISQFEPNLVLANYATSNGDSEASSATHPVAMGILQDLLEWNRLDPVDDYEIHRNNLIFNNFQGNRNPFIDFPQWADYIWGTSEHGNYNSALKGSANPANDPIASGTTPTPSGNTSSTSGTTHDKDKGTGLDIKWIIVGAVVGVVLLVVLIAVFMKLSKRNKKKVAKGVKKTLKKQNQSNSKKKK